MILVSFDGGRIGRKGGVPDQWFSTRPGGIDLAQAMFQFVRKRLKSKDVEVLIRNDGTGEVRVGGLRRVATFTWKEVSNAEGPRHV